MLNTKLRKIVPLILILSLLFVGCGKTEETTTVENKSEDTVQETSNDSEELILKIGAESEFKKCSEGRSLIFDFPLGLDDNGVPTPYIIKDWEIGSEGDFYKLTMEKGIKFHDGTELTPEILKSSIEYWGEHKNSNYPKYLKEIKVVGDDTLEVSFTEPYSVFIEDLTKIYVTKPEDVDDKGNILNYNGTGPFILENEGGSEGVTLFTKNNDYWNEEKKPEIEKLEWVAIEDPMSRKLALESGQVDVIGISEHFHSIPYQLESELDKKSEFESIKKKYIDVNAYSFNWIKGPFKDINLRKAVCYGIDRETLVNELFFGMSEATGDYLNPKYIDGPKNQEKYEYNIDKAKEYLEKGGYKDTNGNGIIEKDGKDINIKIVTRDDQEAKDTAVFIQSELLKLGIGSDIVATDKKVVKEMFEKGDYDLGRTHPWKAPLITHMKWRGLLDGYDSFGAGYNVDPKLAEITDKMMKTNDKEEISKLANEIWKIEYDFAPVVGLCSRGRVAIYSNKWEGFQIRENNMLIDLSEVKMK